MAPPTKNDANASVSGSDEDAPADDLSNATQIFAQQTDKQFHRGFKKFMPPHVRKRDKKESKSNEEAVALIEAKEKVASLTRQLDLKTREIERLQQFREGATKKIEEYREREASFHSELEKSRRQNRNSDEGRVKERILLENYRAALSKYVTWHAYSTAQISLLKELLEERGGWTEANRYKLYFAQKEVQPISVDDDSIQKYCQGTVLDYEGIEEVDKITEAPVETDPKFQSSSCQTEKANAAGDDDEPSTCAPLHATPVPVTPANHQALTAATATATATASAAAATNTERAALKSVVNASPEEELSAYLAMSPEELRILEFRETIQRLEVENEKLKEQRMILIQKARTSTLLEEEKSDLLRKLDILQRQNQQILEEHAKMKEAMGGGAGAGTSTDESRRIAEFFQQKYLQEITDLQTRLAAYEPLHASETTRIMRFEGGNNPLDEAHQEYLLSQAAAFANPPELASKRLKLDRAAVEESEEMSDLRQQMQNAQKQYERSLSLQKTLAVQYRELVSVLTGFTIKMREEGLIEIGNILNMGGTFIFQKHDGGINILQNDCADKWRALMDNYLGRLRSIPAFLAAVTIALVENDVSMASSTLNFTYANRDL